MNGKNTATINKPRPTRKGKLINNMFISGTMRAKTARITINNRKAANIGTASFRPYINIVEPAETIPWVKTGIVGMLPAGNVS